MIDSSDGRPIATITHMPRPTSPAAFAHPYYSPEEFAELKDTFDRVCAGRRHKGRRAFSLDQYFGFFNVTDTQKGGPYVNSVEGKFRAHDLDGDGMLTFDEIQLVCDADGSTADERRSRTIYSLIFGDTHHPLEAHILRNVPGYLGSLVACLRQ
ncbi:hypothetical protein G647_05935 [Cladophialophora carrionii CBS 160.54]|uniref:EF-hand domain-containing protein n=1 Tax=Cladophialophora carrionii CBS 160.54 TaxID=1279043 RepID=V9D5F8_9EURO|nr:uncharacterized protein G647_05935 [Cladophialophora carrionii CBS 160.54]ETI21866.1 hypothetical protein G647_05935 [Cladophialophora carrionii CBS 160.54]